MMMATSKLFGRYSGFLEAAKVSSASFASSSSAGNGSGLNRVLPVSPQLGKFLGASEASRTDTIKKIWEYIKRHNLQDSCPSIKNILLLDSDGNRVAVKYYSDEWLTNSAKEAFEKALFSKTQKTNARTEAEIAMFENHIVVYKFVQDLHFFVTGAEGENELILVTVLQGFFDAVGLLLRGNVDKKEALENLDLVLLCLDEIVDGGVILETDANAIAGKVASHSVDAAAPLSEQTISQALATAREHLARSLLK
ncbi:hypothetical protein HRI_004926000 [Hibiscus trionum]|uniref:Coatomer subunit zeta n=1 Tax=Hibiscus trionum TaxID=183268 RepID=A0A9W7JGW2_HIBTR|nr:hypothetical protein HRI_004926000 [Hibiscus trionum]